MARIAFAADELFFYNAWVETLAEKHTVIKVDSLPELKRLIEGGVDLIVTTTPLALGELYEERYEGFNGLDLLRYAEGRLTGFALVEDLRDKGDKTPVIWLITAWDPPEKLRRLANVASFYPCGSTLDDLVVLVDEMLAKAKHAGA